MKYDIITELKSKHLIDSLDYEEQKALQKMIKGLDHGPNSVEKDKNEDFGLIRYSNSPTCLSFSKGGRELRRGSDPKEKVKCQALVELLPAGLCTFTVTKYDETGFRILRFQTSTKKTHVPNKLEIKYYDYEATTFCGNKLGELEEQLLEYVGIIPDDEEIVQLPDGFKGMEEIYKYINIALANPNNSYTKVVKALVNNKRIGQENSDNVISINSDGNIEINRNNKTLINKFVL